MPNDPDNELDDHDLHALELLDTVRLIRAAEEVPPPKDEQH